MFDSNFKKMSNIVHHEGKCYFVDTANTSDRGLETMVFESDWQAETNDENVIDWEVIDWNDLHVKLHDSAEEAIKHHEEVCANIGKFI